jgi:hypothetical protein
MGTKIMPVITGTLRTIKNGSYQNIQLLQGHPAATELQEVALMGIAHIIPKVLW